MGLYLNTINLGKDSRVTGQSLNTQPSEYEAGVTKL
jgi:hypothetical protein